MTTQTWFSLWEDDIADGSIDVSKIIEKERNNKQAPQRYQQFFERISTYIKTTQQETGTNTELNKDDLDNGALDYSYKGHVLTLQANYNDLEQAYKKQYMDNLDLQQTLSDTQLEFNLEKQKLNQQIADATRLADATNHLLRESIEAQLELRNKVEKLTQQHTVLETSAGAEQKRLNEQIQHLKHTVLKATEQNNIKDNQLHLNARKRQQMEGKLMETHKDLINTQSQLAAETNKVALLTKYIQDNRPLAGRADQQHQLPQQQSPRLPQQQSPQLQQWSSNQVGQARSAPESHTIHTQQYTASVSVPQHSPSTRYTNYQTNSSSNIHNPSNTNQSNTSNSLPNSNTNISGTHNPPP